MSSPSPMLTYPSRPRIPQELVDMIIGFVDDPTDWKQCALVCRSWIHASHLHLFREISVAIGEFRVPPVIRLQAVLNKSPYLARHVRSLKIERIIDDDFFVGPQEQLLSIMLPLFALVHTFVFISYGDEEEEFMIDEMLRNAVGVLLRSSLLKHVTLHGLVFLNFGDFSDLIGTTIHSLSTLHFRGIIRYRPVESPRPTTKSGPPVVLDTLIVDHPGAIYLEWLESLSHPLIVKKLVMSGVGPSSHLVGRLASGLEELCLLLDHDFAPFPDFSRLPCLTKLTVKYPHEELYDNVLIKIPEDNHLESLELHITDFESLEALSIRITDVFLTSGHFPCLKRIVLRVDTDSYETPVFKFICKYLKTTIGTNLLYLRFQTGEILHPSQIRDQASRRELYFPSDFPWFLDELQVEETVQETVAECIQGIDEEQRVEVEGEGATSDENREGHEAEEDDADDEDADDSDDIQPSSTASKGKGRADPADLADPGATNGDYSPQASAAWDSSCQKTDDSNYVYYGGAEQPAYLVAQEYDANNDPTSHQYASSSQVTLEAFYPQQVSAVDNDAVEQAYAPAPQTEPAPSTQQLAPLDAPYQQEHYGSTDSAWSKNANAQSGGVAETNSVYYYPETTYSTQADSQSTSQSQSTYATPQYSTSTSSSTATYDAPQVDNYGTNYAQFDWSASGPVSCYGDNHSSYHQYSQSNAAAASTSPSHTQWTSSDSSYPSYHPVSHTANDDNGLNGSTWNPSHHAVASTTASGTYSREMGGYQGHYSMAQSSGMVDNWASASGSQHVYSTGPSGDTQQALHSYQQNDHPQYDHYGNTTQAHQEQPMSAYQYQYGHDSNSKDAHQPSTTHQPSIETSVSSAPVSYFIPQPQFQSVPQIPTPSNPSYYKRSFEFVENSLLTKVREVVTRSPYQRQVYFSQTLAPDTSYQPQSGS
ncbi:hypothetical protein ONZ45_g14423 [Pleurotus djamor]|nr:hypothetical protein ONZ45_g14423 [Pleurotus djamor]